MSVNMTQRMEIRKISELIPYERNARTHPAGQIEKLRRSLREFGFVSPILIDSAGNVIAGHGRLEAAKLEGITEAPCVLVEHLNDAQRRAYILADNRLAELSGWDEELRQAELLSLRDEGIDITLTGFAASEVVLTPTDEITEDECDLTPPAVPVAKPGQLWQLGRHRLLCGDATSPPPSAVVRGRRAAGRPAGNRPSVWRGLPDIRRIHPERRKEGRCSIRLPAAGIRCSS